MPYKLRKAPKRDLYWVIAQDGRHMSKDPIPKERAMAQMRALYANERKSGGGDCEEEVEYEGGTHRENFYKAHKLSPSTKPSLAGVAKISGVPKSILQQVYNRGIGAYSTQPKSVRLKGSYVKNVNAPMKKKLSKEQWAWARVYSFLDGNPKHDNDLRANKKKTGKGSCCEECEKNTGGTMCGGGDPARPRLKGGVKTLATDDDKEEVQLLIEEVCYDLLSTFIGEMRRLYSDRHKSSIRKVESMAYFPNAVVCMSQVSDELFNRVIQIYETDDNDESLSDILVSLLPNAVSTWAFKYKDNMDDTLPDNITRENIQELQRISEQGFIRKWNTDAVPPNWGKYVNRIMGEIFEMSEEEEEEEEEEEDRPLPPLPPLDGSGGPHQSTLQKMSVASYKPELTSDIDGYKLVEKHPTIRFYQRGDEIIVAIRGTQGGVLDEDWRANYTLATGYIRSTDRFKKDLKILEAFEKKYPNITKDEDGYKYIGVAHSLGGALLDQMLDLGLIQKGVSYNPAVNISDLGKHLPNKRIYSEKDPLYAIYGSLLADKPEVRKTNDSLWISLGKWAGGVVGLASAISSYLSNHKISNPTFEGGAKMSWITKFGLTPTAYLKEVRRRAKAHGYPANMLGFADDGVHKLAIPDHEGRIRRFGRVGYGDFVLYSHKNKALALKKQSVFHKSHSKIKGNWQKDDFSPNNLALRILW